MMHVMARHLGTAVSMLLVLTAFGVALLIAG